MQGYGTLMDENGVDAGNDTTQRPTKTPQRVVSTMTVFIAINRAPEIVQGSTVSAAAVVESSRLRQRRRVYF